MKIYDVIGIGFGPGNIALAAAFEESEENISTLYLESKPSCIWQDSMMIVNADIQHSPFMDLVTPRNPQSYYSFINYLHKTNKMFEHFNLGLEFPLREEYADYIAWVAKHFSHLVNYNQRCTRIEVAHSDTDSEEILYVVKTECGNSYYCRNISLGTGRTPNIPKKFSEVDKERLIHVSNYLQKVSNLPKSAKKIAVIGASQSAVEIILHLTQTHPELEVKNFIRHFAYRQKDLSPQMEASIYPKYVREHYDRTWEQRKRFNDDLKYQNYSSADMDVLKELNLHNYLHKLRNDEPLYEIVNNSHIDSVAMCDGNKNVVIRSSDIYKGSQRMDEFDVVVLATGFRDLGPNENQEKTHFLLENLSNHFRFDDHGVIEVEFEYFLRSLDSKLPRVYLNGLCEGTHGVSDAGSFSLLALRSKIIADSIVSHIKLTKENYTSNQEALMEVV